MMTKEKEDKKQKKTYDLTKSKKQKKTYDLTKSKKKKKTNMLALIIQDTVYCIPCIQVYLKTHFIKNEVSEV